MSLIFGLYYFFILRNNGTAMAVLAAPLPAALLSAIYVLVNHIMCIWIHINSSHMFASRTFLLFAQLCLSLHSSRKHDAGAMY